MNDESRRLELRGLRSSNLANCDTTGLVGIKEGQELSVSRLLIAQKAVVDVDKEIDLDQRLRRANQSINCWDAQASKRSEYCSMNLASMKWEHLVMWAEQLL